ncbi:hypothetical protein [Thermococcus sp.]
MLDEDFSALIPQNGVVLPRIRNTEIPLHPEILESYENRKPVEFVLELVPETFKITKGEELIEYSHYYPTERYYGRRTCVKWDMMRGFIRTDVRVRGRINRIGRSYFVSLNSYGNYVLETFSLGIPVYVKLSPEKFRVLKPKVGDVIEVSSFWFSTGLPEDESVKILEVSWEEVL